MWGSTTPNTNTTCDWTNAPFNNGANDYDSNYFITHKSEWLDDKDNLKPEFDAATQIMRGDWRMPTKAEFDELISNTTTGWIEDFNGSGVNCIKFTSKKNGNSIFFPASGYRIDSSLDFHGYGAYVWSSSLNTDPRDAYSISFESADVFYSTDLRYNGFVVRGVFK